MAGFYDVSLWYPEGSNRATNATWWVSFGGGTTNGLGLSLGVTWATAAGVTDNTITLPLSRTNRAVFFRLISP